MIDIAIYGAGGFGREIACLLKRINEISPKWNLIGFFDDDEKCQDTEYGKILGGIDKLNSYPKDLDLCLAIGNPKIVKRLVSKIENTKIKFPNIISPDCIFLDGNNKLMGKGNIICTGCLISCNVSICDFNCFNGYITIGHDSKIGNFNSFMPAVRISGEVTIGNENFFGVNSVILQQLKIGNNVIVGACSLILRKTKDGCTYIGNPAKKVEY